ncbi:MAG TPA: formate dehydrogenase accessory sulfurtransferase FdhD [Candidatus Sulfotelmatobacter sp.]|nr:formate dehydrogenase accessory sulfurtransferase FdhD [Candidatus Sulfotelmatobacter sp.]
MNDPRVTTHPVTRWSAAGRETLDDAIAVERALEIRVDGRPLAVTLRTPGDDEELALGFLAGEGVIRGEADVAGLAAEPASCADEADRIEVRLAPGVSLDWSKLERHFAATAACGLCGRAHLESLRAGLAPLAVETRVSAARLVELPARLASVQRTFAATGGLHAAAWCAEPGLEPEALREDVGRHNAVDKIAGWLIRARRYPASAGVLWVSGRAGAEIVLKAARARIPVLAAVGAPSSLALELAQAAGLTLIGFLREGRMNVYCGEARITA